MSKLGCLCVYMAVYYNMGTFALVCFAHDNLQSLVSQNMYVHAQLVMFVVQVESRGMGVEGGRKSRHERLCTRRDTSF